MEILKKIEKYFDSLELLSFDDSNKTVVCKYKNKFINFDDLKKERRSKKLPLSPDMLYIDDAIKEVWFVEFKSSTKENLENKKYLLKRKLLDGLIIFYEIFQNYYEYKKYYFVVYNEFDNKEDELLEILSNKNIDFGLEELEGKIVDGVFTDNCKTFVKIWQDRFKIDFTKG